MCRVVSFDAKPGTKECRAEIGHQLLEGILGATVYAHRPIETLGRTGRVHQLVQSGRVPVVLIGEPALQRHLGVFKRRPCWIPPLYVTARHRTGPVTFNRIAD